MRTTVWLGAAALLVLCVASSPPPAHAGDPLKPYVFLVLDTSGSMTASTGSPNSCGTPDTRIDHAKCAINNIANSYGDMVLALGRFRAIQGGVYAPGTPSPFGCTLGQLACQADANIDKHIEVLSPLIDGTNDRVAIFTDATCGTCGFDPANDPEIIGATSGTPIAGALVGVKKYWQGITTSTDGTTTIWPAGAAATGYDPIRNDPLKDVFLPSGEQCRPYVTIMLTDGDESCGDNFQTAAASLLTTVVDGKTYKIRTRPIGFGYPNPPDLGIEQIAQAGGAVNGPGNEGFYASNESELQLAISSILADAIRAETCNNLDDDCDVAVDEDFPSKNQLCTDGGVGICQGSGTYQCRGDFTGTECVITNPGQPIGTEICNGLDDDCDTKIDEGDVCVGCSGVELCNNTDDDCDGNVDENLTRPCGTDVGECTAGAETCSAGVWGGCTATGPLPEVCDSLDNDCDGSVNGFAQTCSNVPGGNPNVGLCHPGDQVCPVSGLPFGPCLGEVVPATEVCDLQDNDCDGTVDEDIGGADCSTACGVGQTVCVAGVLTCDAVTAPNDDTCDGNDDDCDGTIDEDAANGGPCDDDGTVCGGELVCMTGSYICIGEPVRPEVCDCQDNNCDTFVDENNGNCPAGSTCSDCGCRFPCQPGEFPCSAGQVCNSDNFCEEDRCFQVNCPALPDGTATECVPDTGLCVSVCEGVTCNPGLVCYGPTGACLPDTCETFPERCADNERCQAGVCVVDPCDGVTCGDDTYCSQGTCVSSCAGVECARDERCVLGACEPNPCGGPCPNGQVCNDAGGDCGPNPCNTVNCGNTEVCDPQTGDCIADVCVGVTCPDDNQVCRFGTCYEINPTLPDDIVTTGGGGGCNTSGGNSGAIALALVGLAVLGARRRRSKEAGKDGAA